MKNPIPPQVTYRGIGGLSILGCIFVIAKLFGFITWSWWLVLLPFYFWLAVLVAVLGIMGAIALCMAIIAFSVITMASIHEWWEARKWRKIRAKNNRR